MKCMFVYLSGSFYICRESCDVKRLKIFVMVKNSATEGVVVDEEGGEQKEKGLEWCPEEHQH